MIAIFTATRAEIARLKLMPKKNFVRIKDKQCVIGMKFTGVIVFPGWHKKEELRDAIELLEQRQPELFKD